MSGYSSLPARPVEASPIRSPERPLPDERGRGGYDVPPHRDYERGYDSDRHYAVSRDYDERWQDDYERKRRRSPSPGYPHQRQRRRSPSPGRYNQLPDPASLETVLTFKQFAEWFRVSHPQTAKDDDEDLRRIRGDVDSGVLPKSVLVEKHGMAKRYERYKKEYYSRQLFALYLTHRDDAWFQERYGQTEEAAALRRRVNRQGRVPGVEQYIAELRDGKWDDANYDHSEDKLQAQDDPEALDRALGDEPHDPLRMVVPPRPGQVFVKTVPPNTKRKDLEGIFAKASGFQWLALSEPSMKRSFHRVGWAQYEEGVKVEEVVDTIDGSKVDNFIFHMGVNASAIVGRIRLTPAIATTLSRLETDAERARELALKLEDGLMETDPPQADQPAEGESGDAAEEQDKGDKARGLHERGSDVVADVVTRLLAQQNLDGDELDEEQRVRKAKITLDQYMSYLRNALNSCYYCVVPTAFPEELQRKCVQHLRAPEEASAPEESGRDGEEETKEAEGTGAEGREVEETAAREAPSKRYTYPSKSSEERWVENLDLKVRGVIDEDPDVVEYGGRDIEDETRRLLAPYIKQEEADKYRCKECGKLFRAPEFVMKHIISKHSVAVKDKLDEAHVFNAFALDPQHLQPTSTTLAAVDDQLPSRPALPAFNPAVASQAMFNPAAASQPGFNMAMQQQMMMMMHMQMMMHGGNSGGAGPAGAGASPAKGRTRDFDASELPPAPPGGEDPRARKGPISYRDLDEPSGAGDGGLPY
ncbi:hypothetical protein CcaverHIS641_0603940 [Cutaneotrichosporon cavernicola]|nr:hypothetical protein CcaverHIS641_0603940 [Cutaneotrichosporon cavernicola]